MDIIHCVVDIRDILDSLAIGSEQLPDVVVESWIAKHYTNAWGVPCISESLLNMDYETHKNFSENRQLILTAANDRKVNPLRYLPSPGEIGCADRGMWLLVKKNYLLMGDFRAIKKLRRSVRN